MDMTPCKPSGVSSTVTAVFPRRLRKLSVSPWEELAFPDGSARVRRCLPEGDPTLRVLEELVAYLRRWISARAAGCRCSGRTRVISSERLSRVPHRSLTPRRIAAIRRRGGRLLPHGTHRRPARPHGPLGILESCNLASYLNLYAEPPGARAWLPSGERWRSP
jgi:hypothetical protein